MKKLISIISIIAAIATVLAMALPVGADGTGTGTNTVTVVSGGTADTPIVKAMWITTCTNPNDENGDPGHATPGTQVLPNLGWQNTTDVYFWVVATDPLGVGFITSVYMDVYYPGNSGSTYQVVYDPGNPVGPGEGGSQKFEWQLTLFTPTTAYPTPQAAFLAASPNPTDNVNIVTFNNTTLVPPFVYPGGSTNPATQQGDVAEELQQGQARLYVGHYRMDNCELAGIYGTVARADNLANVKGYLSSTWGLNWLAAKGADFDFSGVNYGSIGIGYDKEISGDYAWSATPNAADDGGAHGATIANIGNTYLEMTVKQDDMGFGQTASNNPPWNVYYDARLGDTYAPTTYYPSVTLANTSQLAAATPTTIPEILALCSLEKVDFSIHVVKDPGTGNNGTYTGNMILGVVAIGGPPTVGHEYDPYSSPTRPNPYVSIPTEP